MLAALVLAAVGQARFLDPWILKSDRIALGRVERVVQFPAEGRSEPLRVSVVHVARRFVGPEGESVLCVVDTPAEPGPLAGERALFFLAQDRAKRGADDARMLAAEANGQPVWELLTGWHRAHAAEAPELFLPHWMALYWMEKERMHAGESPALEPVLLDLEAALERTLPAFHASYVTNSGPPGPGLPSGWDLRLGPDRGIVEDGSRSGSLSEEEWTSLFGVVERTRFAELPEVVGQDLAPCLDGVSLELYTRSGPHKVWILEDAPEGDDALSEWTRAREMWNALPGARRPKR